MGYKGLSENSFQSSKRYIITIHFISAIDISRAHTYGFDSRVIDHKASVFPLSYKAGLSWDQP